MSRRVYQVKGPPETGAPNRARSFPLNRGLYRNPTFPSLFFGPNILPNVHYCGVTRQICRRFESWACDPRLGGRGFRGNRFGRLRGCDRRLCGPLRWKRAQVRPAQLLETGIRLLEVLRRHLRIRDT